MMTEIAIIKVESLQTAKESASRVPRAQTAVNLQWK